MPVELSPDEIPGALALRAELKPMGVVYMDRQGPTRVFVPELLLGHVRARIAAITAGDGDEAQAASEPMESSARRTKSRRLSDLSHAERRRLRRAIARHVDTGGEPTLASLESEYRISHRAVRAEHAREVEKRNH